MGMIVFKQKGDFKKTMRFLEHAEKMDFTSILKQYGDKGITALNTYTPVDSGLTASSWFYEISRTRKGYCISFNNSNIQNGVPIALIIQFGHGTGTGGYVQGIDYINPALRPVFEQLANLAWEEVTNR